MIPLKDLPYEQKIYLARQAEPFFLSYKKTKQLTSSYELILQALSEVLENPKHYSKEIWTLVSAISQTIRYNNIYFQLPLDKNHYYTANRITKQKISPIRMANLLGHLEGLGLIILYKGFLLPSDNPSVSTSMRSLVKVSEDLLGMFDVSVCKRFGTAREYDLVILKDRNGALLSTKGLRGVSNERLLLTNMNKIISRSCIKIQGQVVNNIVYKTVFKGDLNSGGRLYAGSFSTESSEARGTITIDDQPTCEVDYKNNHIRILYNKYSIDYQEDAYQLALERYDLVGVRGAAKIALLVCLNASSKRQATYALTKKLSNKTLHPTINNPRQAAKDLLKAIRTKHYLISDHFYKAEWSELQYLDSCMAKHIIKHFNVLGKVVLCYHDSFVVKSEDFDLLQNSMKEAWEQVLGTHHGFCTDVKFYNE